MKHRTWAQDFFFGPHIWKWSSGWASFQWFNRVKLFFLKLWIFFVQTKENFCCSWRVRDNSIRTNLFNCLSLSIVAQMLKQILFNVSIFRFRLVYSLVLGSNHQPSWIPWWRVRMVNRRNGEISKLGRLQPSFVCLHWPNQGIWSYALYALTREQAPQTFLPPLSHFLQNAIA